MSSISRGDVVYRGELRKGQAVDLQSTFQSLVKEGRIRKLKYKELPCSHRLACTYFDEIMNTEISCNG